MGAERIMITDERLKELEDAAKCSHPGVWMYGEHHNLAALVADLIALDTLTERQRAENLEYAKFMELAPPDVVLELCATVRELQANLETPLGRLCKSLGWQGGTIHQVVVEVEKLRRLADEVSRIKSRVTPTEYAMLSRRGI